jgi:hypothetical protein
MINKILTIILLTFSLCVFPQGKVLTKSPNTKYRVEKNIYINIVESVDKDHEAYAHPVELSNEAIGRILYALKVDAARMSPVQIFTIEEIRKLVDDGRLKEAFLKVGKFEKVELTKMNEYIDENDEVVYTKSEKLFLFFKNKDELYVTYIPSGFKFFRTLMKGLDMKDGVRWDGKPFNSTISINKKLWTVDIKKPIFPVSEDITQLIKKIRTKGNSEEGKKETNKALQENQDFSLDALQAELEKLKKMLDKKIISIDEYKKLKKKVLAKAGL